VAAVVVAVVTQFVYWVSIARHHQLVSDEWCLPISIRFKTKIHFYAQFCARADDPFFVKKKTRRKDQVLLMRESMMHEAQYRTESNESWRMKIFVFKNIVSVYAQKQNVSC
jgi:hypothetical protein